jgi:predicted O-methyltransferase YrrM
MSHPLFTDIEKQYAAEMETVFIDLTKKIDDLRQTAIEKYPDIPRGPDELDSGTISVPDAKLLYLLVRYFKPKVIFEIGTWIGTSSMIMAEAMKKNNNDGHIYTCDANTFFAVDDLYQDVITTINAYSDVALDSIPTDTKVDFVFADGELTFATIKKLKPLLHKDAIVSTHDFTLPAEKGVLNLIRMQLASVFSYSYILPQDIDNQTYNSGAFGILIQTDNLNQQTTVTRVILTIKYGMILLKGKVIRKL